MMRKVLCFGDSNTWGYIPGSGGRYAFSTRWTGILQNRLGNQALIIEQGLNGRTTNTDDPGHPDRNGATLLGPVLQQYAPLSLVVIMLGTNDMKHEFNLSAEDIVQGARQLVNIVKQNQGLSPIPQVLLISPPRIRFLPFTSVTMFAQAEAKSKALPLGYKAIAKDCGCFFFNATEAVSASLIDGVHLGKAGHRKLGEMLAKEIKDILQLNALV